MLPMKLHKIRQAVFKTPCRTAFTVHTKQIEKFTPDEVHRASTAPWIPIGQFQKGLLTHLTMTDICRALAVLRICSFDVFVDNSMRLFQWSRKFGNIGEWIVRKTFFNQFVGGDTYSQMSRTVNALRKRNLTLMVAPVLEEDIHDKVSSNNQYDENLNDLKNIAEMTFSLEDRIPVLQLKLSALMPATVLEEASQQIDLKWKNEDDLAHIVTKLESIDHHAVLPIRLNLPSRKYFIDGVRRAGELARHAERLNIRLVVDAEFYSCRSAISAIALALISRHNTGGKVVVGNTIQAYLKDAVVNAKIEFDTLASMGVHWFGKVVRGAYMDRERLLAKAGNYCSPICENYEDTNESYNNIITYIMNKLKAANCHGAHLIVATHNEKSIRVAAQTMKDLNLDHSRVSFAQIYGMGDYLSAPLVEKGYKVYKSAPYGPMKSVMPYLTRRVSENRSVLRGTREEREMLRKEALSRLFFS